MNGTNFPEKIRDFLGTRAYETDTVGLSASEVLIFDDCVLKISETAAPSVNEWRVMEQLHGKLPVPEVLCRASENGREYVVMSRLDGEMSCAARYLDDVPALVKGLAEGLTMLWNAPVSGDLTDFSLDNELRDAESRIDTIDWDDKPDELRRQFPSARHLLDWLKENKPEEDCVLSHGDYCLPNVFLDDGRVSGFLDLGHCGTADRYRDISLGLKSLKNNLGGVFGGPVREGYDPAMLFDALGEPMDEDKLRYYLLLDELW
ncbi:MAG: aminoglycoside 3'-phosphotransferase [Clostridia bacterium]|nr:aminoglycoside 3'-phosphotransferase [Clostridia bacterium]